MLVCWRARPGQVTSRFKQGVDGQREAALTRAQGVLVTPFIEDDPVQGAQQLGALPVQRPSSERFQHAKTEGAQKQFLHSIPSLMLVAATVAGELHEAELMALIQKFTVLIKHAA
jgi:hypothetical protein